MWTSLSLAYITEKFPRHQRHPALAAVTSRTNLTVHHGDKLVLPVGKSGLPWPLALYFGLILGWPALLHLALSDYLGAHSSQRDPSRAELDLADDRRPRVIPASVHSSLTYLDPMTRTLMKAHEMGRGTLNSCHTSHECLVMCEDQV